MSKTIGSHSRWHALALVAPIAVMSSCGGARSEGFSPAGDGGDGAGDGKGGTFVTGDGGGNPDFNGCAVGEAAASRQPVYLLFILDGSGSMSHDSKWDAATAAIDALFTDLATLADPGLGAGLIVFSDSQDPNLNTGGAYPSSRDVPIAFVDQAQLAKLVGRTKSPDAPQSNTPTGRALSGGYDTLGAFQPALPLQPYGKKVVVLITDGIPTDHNCKTTNQNGTDDYTQNACVKMAAAQITIGAPKGPIETFVIGVGPLPGDFQTYDPYFLAALAMAGGSAPAGCDPKANSGGANGFCYFNVDPTNASPAATQKGLEDAIGAIRGQLATCTLRINPTDAGTIDPGKVNVVVNGVTVPQDATNGWTYDDPQNPTSVTLHGAPCDTLKNDASAKVSIVLGCKTQVN
jgi:hypothetical protein